jgi:hypothetical protein
VSVSHAGYSFIGALSKRALSLEKVQFAAALHLSNSGNLQFCFVSGHDLSRAAVA